MDDDTAIPQQPDIQVALLPFYIVVGQIVTKWAFLENTLDLLVALTWHQVGGYKVQKEIPRSLGPKLDYLEKALLRLAPYKAESHILAEYMFSLRELGTRRHWLTHGTILAVPRDQVVDPYVFHKISYDRKLNKDIHSNQVLSMTMADLSDTLKNIQLMSDWLISTFENIRKAVDEAGWIKRV